MAVLKGSSSAAIDTPIDRCWSIVEDVPRWPEWTSSFQTMDVLERDERGRALVCNAVSDAKVRKVRVRVRFSYEEAAKVSMHMIEGDLDSMDAAWELQDLGGSRTKATYVVAIDLGKVGSYLPGPLKGTVVRLLAKRRVIELTKRVAQA